MRTLILSCNECRCHEFYESRISIILDILPEELFHNIARIILDGRHTARNFIMTACITANLLGRQTFFCIFIHKESDLAAVMKHMISLWSALITDFLLIQVFPWVWKFLVNFSISYIFKKDYNICLLLTKHALNQHTWLPQYPTFRNWPERYR